MLVLECPKCTTPLLFRRSCGPSIDGCGFESYRLDCPECDATVAGIVDPFDDTLMVCVFDNVAG
jgi:hypothetical protein